MSDLKKPSQKVMIRDANGTWIFAGLAFTCILNNNLSFWSMIESPELARGWLYSNQAGMLPCDLLSSVLMLLMLMEPLEGAMMTTLAGAVFMFHGIDYAFAASALHSLGDGWSTAAYIGVAVIQELFAIALFVGYKHPVSLILPFKPVYEEIAPPADIKV